MHLPHRYTNLAENAEMEYGAGGSDFLCGGVLPMSTPDSISGTYFDQTRVPDCSSALPADLVRALGWLRGHLSEPIQLDLLAQISGVRPRTLETHFKMFLGTTPLGWVRRMRLARARQELLHSGPQATVTDIALASGFSQLCRFAAEYRKAFGELPSRTVERTRRPSTKDADMDLDEAVRLTLGALPFAFAVAPDQCSAALEELGRPQELAPTYGLPKAVAAWCWGQRAAHRFSSSPKLDRERACTLADEAYDLAPHDAMTLTLSSGALVLAHRLEEADRRLEHALALDPWLAYAWTRRGWMSAYLGDSDAAIRELNIALHLMPFEPLRHLNFIGMGCAHFVAGRYDRAALWVQSGVDACPGSFWAQRVAVAAAALTGARGEARRMCRQLTRKDPDLTLAEARQAWPFTPAFMSRLGDGLEIAGLPRA
jgi:AraC-like DNA-binding protein